MNSYGENQSPREHAGSYKDVIKLLYNITFITSLLKRVGFQVRDVFVALPFPTSSKRKIVNFVRFLLSAKNEIMM